MAYRGSLRFLTFYLAGVPFTSYNYRMYSTTQGDTTPTARDFVPSTNHAIMVAPIAQTPPPSQGMIAVAAYDGLRHYTAGSWTTTTYTDHFLRIRDPRIIFLDYTIPASEVLVSVGRPDAPAPAVLRPDPHMDYDEIDGVPNAEIDGSWTLDFTNRIITTTHNRAWTARKFYAYIKQLLSRYTHFDHPLEWTYDGDTLDIGQWSLTFGANSTIDGGGSIITTGQITPGPSLTNTDVTLIDADGVTVSITSTAPGARCVISHGSSITYHDLPYADLLPVNTDITVVVPPDMPNKNIHSIPVLLGH